MADPDVISLSSDSSRPTSPLFNISEIFNVTEECLNLPAPIVNKVQDHLSDNILSDCIETRSSSSYSKTTQHRTVHDLSEDSEDSENNSRGHGGAERHESKAIEESFRPSYSALLSSETDRPKLTSQNNIHNLDKPPVKRKKNVKDGTGTRKTKEQRLEEKLIKQKEKERKKAEKIASQEIKNQLKPENCIKFMTVILDESLVTCPFGGTLLAAIQNSESKCQVTSQAVPQTISWTRELPGPSIKEESDLMLVWPWQVVIPAVKNHLLCLQIQEIQMIHPSKIIFLVVYGLNGYFSYLKSKRRNFSGDPSTPTKRKKSKDKEEFPYVTKKEIEEELVELLLTTNCNHRLIESPEDLGQFTLQITKAIAETPFKLDKQKRQLESLEWFAMGDSRDCVPVDKDGNGLLRLWQQQLCQFNLAGHDTAQAIAAVYPSPLSLTQAYKKCTSQKEGEDLLKDIQVRRCQGPLSSSRRIGPELSKKIYNFFCSSEGDAPLSQE